MFTPWIKRKALKKATSDKRLVVPGEPIRMITLLSLSAILVGVGVFVIQRSLADSATPSATPTPIITPTTVVTVSPSVMPSTSPRITPR